MLRLISTLFLFMACSAQANDLGQSPDFYLGSSPIDGRSEAARDAAIRDALGEVLVRMTGDVSITMNPAANALIVEAKRYMRSFRYDAEPIIISGEQQEGAAQRMRQLLKVSFEPNALTRAARAQGLPLWEPRRPQTVVWMVGPTADGPRQMYSRELIELRLPGLLKAAQRRGLPLVLPQLDQQDISNISSYEIIGEDFERVKRASARYPARHMLLLRIERRDGLWHAFFSFLQPQQLPIRWQAMADNPNQALIQGFDRYADELSARYATRASNGWEQEARLRVVGLHDLHAYARVQAFLENHNLINFASPSAVIKDEVVFSLRFEGETLDLERALASSGMLRDEPAPIAGVGLIGAVPQAEAGAEESANEDIRAGVIATEPASSGLSFFAVNAAPELRYRYLP